jgi:hypothetical protein
MWTERENHEKCVRTAGLRTYMKLASPLSQKAGLRLNCDIRTTNYNDDDYANDADDGDHCNEGDE